MLNNYTEYTDHKTIKLHNSKCHIIQTAFQFSHHPTVFNNNDF